MAKLRQLLFWPEQTIDSHNCSIAGGTMTRLFRLSILVAWMALFLSACGPTATPTPTTIPTADLNGIKDYLLGQTSALVAPPRNSKRQRTVITNWRKRLPSIIPPSGRAAKMM